MQNLSNWLLDNRDLFDVYNVHDFCGIMVYMVAAYNNKKFMEEFHLDYAVYYEIEKYDIQEVNDVIIIVEMPQEDNMIDKLLGEIVVEMGLNNINPEDYGMDSRNDIIEFALEFLLANIGDAFSE